jgi:hypothetical protein
MVARESPLSSISSGLLRSMMRWSSATQQSTA